MRALVVILLLGALGYGAVLLTRQGRKRDAPPPEEEERLGPYPRSHFYIDHDLFLPANEPKTVPADRAGFMRREDEVFGIVVAGQARAYPVPMISYHHVVNDVINGIPVAVTY